MPCFFVIIIKFCLIRRATPFETGLNVDSKLMGLLSNGALSYFFNEERKISTETRGKIRIKILVVRDLPRVNGGNEIIFRIRVHNE